jgi:hypothetical protein
MSSEVDRAEQLISIQRQIIATFTGDAPAVDEHERGRDFLLLQEEARLREEAEKEPGHADGDPGGHRGGRSHGPKRPRNGNGHIATAVIGDLQSPPRPPIIASCETVF